MSAADEQLEITSRLKLKILERFERLLDDGTLSATDAATCTRLLVDAGWDLSALPGGLKAKLGVAPEALPDVDAPPEVDWS